MGAVNAIPAGAANIAKNHRALIGVCALCVLLLAPFLSRPMHIDDPLFIWTARHIVEHPWDFYGFVINWEGTDRQLGNIFPIPPLTSYFIAGISRIVGWSELGLHLAFLPIAVLAVAGTFLLGVGYCKRPWLCAVLLIVSPAFWVSSTTLMCDTPLLCVWVWAVVFWLRGCQKSLWFFLASAIAMGAAVLTKFTALGLIPLLILHGVLNPVSVKTRIAQIATLVFPVIVIFWYDATFKKLYGYGALQNASFYATESRRRLDISFGLRVIDTLAFFGGGVLAGCLVLFLVRLRTWARMVVTLVVIGITMLLAWSASPPTGWARVPSANQPPSLTFGAIAFYFQFTLMLVLGLLLAIHCFLMLRRGIRLGLWGDDIFLISWIAGIFIFAGFLNWSINARSILPMLPAACIVVVRGADRFDRLPRVRTAFALVVGAVVALVVVVGDYQMAAIGKNAADLLGKRAVEIISTSTSPAQSKIWIQGHWGLQYYMDSVHLTELDVVTPQYRPGDYVIFPASGFGGSYRAAGFGLVETIHAGNARWIATAEPDIGAGFYHSNGWMLPFVFGPVPEESFLVTRVGVESQVSP